jgi:hypothetical protein
VRCRTAACLWLDEVSGVRRDFEDHVAGIVAEHAVRVRVKVVHEHGGSGDRVGRWGGLFGCDFVECRKNAGVARAAIIHEGAIDCLDLGGALLVKRLGVGVWGRDLRFA